MASPDGKYTVEYFEAAAAPLESNVKFKNAKSKKVLRYEFSSSHEEKTFQEMAWSPDSKYLAVISRGTKTSSHIRVFSFVDDKVEEVAMPSPKLGNEKSSGRYFFVKHLKWKDTKLNYYCFGNKADGAGDSDLVPNNWYHYDVTVQLSSAGKKADPKLISVVQTKPK